MGPVSIEKVALERLLAHEWPGNFRELRNSIRTALARRGSTRGEPRRPRPVPIGECRTRGPSRSDRRNIGYRKIKRHGIVIARRPGGC
jgi:transcriptional regulator of acetoin/glycerol metabolism